MKRLLSSLPLITFITSLSTPEKSQALEIRNYSETRHLRFPDFPEAPSLNSNANSIARDIDLTGVGWYAQENRRQYTLVSPQHFVGANHFRPSTSGQLKFVNRDGVTKTYEIGSLRSILNDNNEPTDLFIGTLESPVPASDLVSFQPFLSLAAEGNYQGQSLLFMGHRVASPKNLRIGSGTIGSFTNLGADPITSGAPFNETRAFQIVYSNIGFGGDDAFAQAGDSGSPSLVVVDGRGAIVGTHSAVANASLNIGLAQPGSTITYDTFIPHYIDELNAIMASDGYHMTRAVPGAIKPSTTLTLTPSLPPVIRAGYPFTIDLTVENTGLAENANNLELSATLPAAATANGNLWVNSSSASGIESRRGGLESGSSTTLSITLTAPRADSFDSTLTLSADEFPSAAQDLPLNIIGSFRSFTSSLEDKSILGDDDGDLIPNLLEYAFNGDPEINARSHDGTPVLPAIILNQNTFTIQYARRKDFADRGLTYQLESSPTLQNSSWSSASPESSSSTSLNSEFDLISAVFTPSKDPLFLRVQVTLSEE